MLPAGQSRAGDAGRVRHHQRPVHARDRHPVRHLRGADAGHTVRAAGEGAGERERRGLPPESGDAERDMPLPRRERDREGGDADHRRPGPHHRVPIAGERDALHHEVRPVRAASVDRGPLPTGQRVVHSAAGGSDRRAEGGNTQPHGSTGQEAVGRGERVAPHAFHRAAGADDLVAAELHGRDTHHHGRGRESAAGIEDGLRGPVGGVRAILQLLQRHERSIRRSVSDQTKQRGCVLDANQVAHCQSALWGVHHVRYARPRPSL
mmetsp:Transcript_52861/g.112307  ORF Transcript_52861/g.112307 Transcript_52861/m.112307 type:complete len:264 (+) Transcript_52861:635-1426(+)